jgi:hypothetical protein
LAVIAPGFAALAMIACVASRIFVAPIVRLGLLRWRFVLTRVIAASGPTSASTATAVKRVFFFME